MCVGRAKEGLFAGAMERVAVFVVSECPLDMFYATPELCA